MTTDAEPRGIRFATTDDRVPLVDTLSGAFADGPAAEWLIPDPVARRVAYRNYADLMFDSPLLASGRILTTNDRTGAGIWFEHTKPSEPPSSEELTAVYEALVAAVGEDAATRFVTLDSLMADHQPTEPHDHLAFLGVHRACQNQGIGTALLRHHLRELDSVGMPAWLVATSQSSRQLYQRHQFDDQVEFRPAGGPPFWAMWRSPQPPADDQPLASTPRQPTSD